MDVAHPLNSNKSLLAEYVPLIIVAAAVLLYFPTFIELANRWVQWDESMAHGLPIVAVFVGLLYQRRREFTPQVSGPVERGLALFVLVAMSLAWALFYLVNISLLAQMALVPVLISAFWVAFGFRAVLQHRLLLVLPIFAIPVWDYLNGPLLFLSSEVVGEMVRWAKMPANIQGSSIFIPHGHIMIADGCSGLRYFVVALALAYIIGLLNRYDERKMLLLLSVAALLGIVTNWVRIFILIVIGYQTEMQSPLMEDHEFFGWVLFAVICLPAIYFAPVVRASAKPMDPTGRRLPGKGGWLLAGCFLAAGPAVAYLSSSSASQSVEPVEVLSGLEGVSVVDRLPMAVQVPPSRLTEAYRASGTGVYLQRDQYIRESVNDKLVPYLGRLYDHYSWSAIERSALTVEGVPIRLETYRHQSSGRQVVQAQWFEVGDYQVTSVKEAKLWQVPAALRGQTHFAIHSLQAECSGRDCQRAQERVGNQVILYLQHLDSH